MNELLHDKNIPLKTPPQRKILPINQKFIEAYKLWDQYRKNFPKSSRFTLGTKIDDYFLNILELIFLASILTKEEKLPYLKKASTKLDLLKFLMQIAWELKILENKKYIELSEKLYEIGRMLGGWILSSKNPAIKK